MLFAGFAVADPGSERLAPPSDAARDRRSPGVLGNLVGSWIAYGVGRGGRLELIERHGDWLHLKPAQIEWADRWFERYGAADGPLQPHAARDPHLHLAAGRDREDAVRALHRADR